LPFTQPPFDEFHTSEALTRQIECRVRVGHMSDMDKCPTRVGHGLT